MATFPRPVGPGPWGGEPDRDEWRHAGLPCLAKRGPMGAWCGYVAVPPGHPLHGVDYGQCTRGCDPESYCYDHSPDCLVEVHGGLTYSGLWDGAEGVGICHVPQPGEPADVWWFGFDCAHGGDVVPGLNPVGLTASFLPPRAVYRDLAYVRSEVSRLAEQMASIEAAA